MQRLCLYWLSKILIYNGDLNQLKVLYLFPQSYF